MTFLEGLEVLGVAEGVDAKEARRAYLRLIKIHTPEKDKAAFMRVREAYDIVKATVETRAQWSFDDNKAIAFLRGEDPAAQAEAMPALATAPPPEDPGDDAELPDEHDARELDAYSDEELADLATQLIHAPDPRWSELVFELLHRQQNDTAAGVAEAAAGAALADPLAFKLSMWATTEAALALLERGYADVTKRVLAALDKTHTERVVGYLALRKGMAQELAGLAYALPDGLVIAIAQAIRNSGTNDAEAALHAYAKVHGDAAYEAGELLNANALLLGQAYSPLLMARRTSWRGGFDWSGMRFAWIGIAFIVIRLVLSSTMCTSSSGARGNHDEPGLRDAHEHDDERWRLASEMCIAEPESELCTLARDWANTNRCEVQQEVLVLLARRIARERVEGAVLKTEQRILKRMAMWTAKACGETA